MNSGTGAVLRAVDYFDTPRKAVMGNESSLAGSPSVGVAAAVRGAGGAVHPDDAARRVHRGHGRHRAEQPHGDGIRPRRPPVRARAGGERRARPRRRHDLDRPPSERRLAGGARLARHRVRPRVQHRITSSTCTTPTPIPARRPGRPASTTSSAGSPSTTPTRNSRSSRTKPRSSTGTT